MSSLQFVTRDCAPEFCSCDDIVDSIDSAIKAAALRVSPSVVSVITHNVPDDMILKSRQRMMFGAKGTYVCPGSGIIIQSEDAGDGTYFSTIFCPAYLFERTNAILPHQIEVDVHVSGGKLHKGELLACDFHYNLAAIRIQSDSPLPTATIRHLNDITSIDVDANQNHQSLGQRPFQLRRHSNFNSFKIQSGTKILTIERSWTEEYEILVSTGVFSTRDRLFSVKGPQIQYNGGGAVINYYGEVIGIYFRHASFLPFNLVSRWWDHYKSCRQYHRASFGVEVANLHEAHTDFLNQFVREFPDVVMGVFVKKVEKNSPAYQVGIKRNDVIIKCDGNSVRSKLEFFERVWDNAGRVVELNVLKASNGDQLSLNMTIGDTAPDKLYEWGLPKLWMF